MKRLLISHCLTLTELTFTQEDLEDLGGVQPFALEASKIEQYDFKYMGREQLDELRTYVFDVAPKVIPKKVSERRFEGSEAAILDKSFIRD